MRLANHLSFPMSTSFLPRAARRLALSIAFGSLASLAHGAQVYLMDFNTHTDATSTHPGGAAAWNIYAAPADINNGLIKDTSGSTASGIRLNKSGTLADSGNTGAAAFDNPTGGPSWVTNDGSLADTGVAADYFFTSTSDASNLFTMTFSGLAGGTTVSLDLFFSRANATGNGFYSYSLDGGSTWVGLNVLEKNGALSTDSRWASSNTLATMFRGNEDGNDNGRYMATGEVLIGAPGTIQFKVQDDAATGWAGISAARLTVIPEPSTAALLAGVAGFATLRRRRVG